MAQHFAEKVSRFLHLKGSPPTLITRSLRNTELAVTETRDDNPVVRLSDSMPLEDAYLISLKLRDFHDCECWERGRCAAKSDIRAGATYLYDLRRDPRYVIDKPFHSLFFYLPRVALDDIARQIAAPKVCELACQPGIGHEDPVIRHLGMSLLEALRRPDEASHLFVDHIMLAFTAHVAHAYGEMRRGSESVRGGLAAWQVKRACEKLESDLTGKLSLKQLAADFDLSARHFSRAFRASTGMPPHRWLLHQRVEVAKQLMGVRDLPLPEVAISAGFADQSHFTRVFSSIVGISPAVWRREKLSASASKI